MATLLVVLIVVSLGPILRIPCIFVISCHKQRKITGIRGSISCSDRYSYGLATISGSNSSSTTILCDSYYACAGAIIPNFVSLDAYGALSLYSATIAGVTTFNIYGKIDATGVMTINIWCNQNSRNDYCNNNCLSPTASTDIILARNAPATTPTELPTNMPSHLQLGSITLKIYQVTRYPHILMVLIYITQILYHCKQVYHRCIIDIEFLTMNLVSHTYLDLLILY